MVTHLLKSITAAQAVQYGDLGNDVIFGSSSSGPPPRSHIFIPRKETDWHQMSIQEQRNQDRANMQRMRTKSWQRY